MYHFRNDYSEGCHPSVMEALLKTNPEATAGYGEDEYCAEAADLIRRRFQCPEAAVHFLVGGTQVNTVTITALLRPWEAALTIDTGHIAVHETGAIEARGHKVITVPNHDGKVLPEDVIAVMEAHAGGTSCHMVSPKLLYLSDSTEVGTVYNKSELTALRKVCDQYGLYLYMDGARLASALTASDSDLSPEDLPKLCDAFTLGGTKIGLLIGEALVISNPNLCPAYRSCIKQCGGLLAKGRLLGVQFKALLENDLWLELGRHENTLAVKLSNALTEKGYPLFAPSTTNQVFPVLPKDKIEELREAFTFEVNGPVDEGHDCIRFCTSWATKEEAVDALIHAL